MDEPFHQGLHMWAHLIPQGPLEPLRHWLHDAEEIKLWDVAAQVGEDARQHNVQEVARAGHVVFVHPGDAGLQCLHHLAEEVEVASVAVHAR